MVFSLLGIVINATEWPIVFPMKCLLATYQKVSYLIICVETAYV